MCGGCERDKVCASAWSFVRARPCVCERAYTSADTCSQSLICTCCLVVSRQVSHQPGELLLEEPSANCLNSCLCLCSRFSVCWGRLSARLSACLLPFLSSWSHICMFLRGDEEMASLQAVSIPPFFSPSVSVEHIHSNKVAVFR